MRGGELAQRGDNRFSRVGFHRVEDFGRGEMRPQQSITLPYDRKIDDHARQRRIFLGQEAVDAFGRYVAERIRHRVAELETSFPDGMHSAVVYDTTPFVEESVLEVFKALRDAVILVAIVLPFLPSMLQRPDRSLKAAPTCSVATIAELAFPVTAIVIGLVVNKQTLTLAQFIGLILLFGCLQMIQFSKAVAPRTASAA